MMVVDTGTSPAAARAFVEDIRMITNKPVRYVVNTHFHYDRPRTAIRCMPESRHRRARLCEGSLRIATCFTPNLQDIAIDERAESHRTLKNRLPTKDAARKAAPSNSRRGAAGLGGGKKRSGHHPILHSKKRF
jgi:hypothetical protein